MNAQERNSKYVESELIYHTKAKERIDGSIKQLKKYLKALKTQSDNHAHIIDKLRKSEYNKNNINETKP